MLVCRPAWISLMYRRRATSCHSLDPTGMRAVLDSEAWDTHNSRTRAAGFPDRKLYRFDYQLTRTVLLAAVLYIGATVLLVARVLAFR